MCVAKLDLTVFVRNTCIHRYMYPYLQHEGGTKFNNMLCCDIGDTHCVSHRQLFAKVLLACLLRRREAHSQGRCTYMYMYIEYSGPEVHTTTCT